MATRLAPLAAVFALSLAAVAPAADEDDVLPPSLSKAQQTNLRAFLKGQQAPDRYVPKGAKVVDVAPPAGDEKVVATKEKPIKQYTVRVTPHRPVPGQEVVTRADVYFYRPNPSRGKQGITIKYTVDLTTGKPVGDAEVLTKAHTPLSPEELNEAVAAAKSRSAEVKKLYEGRDAADVRYEYLQMTVHRKTAESEPGDRVARFVFTANPLRGEKKAPAPVAVRVNLTRDLVTLDRR